MLFLELALLASFLLNVAFLFRFTIRLRREKEFTLAQKQVLNTTAGKTAAREIGRKLDVLSTNISKRQAQHLEMYAAAYLKHTDLPPDKVELVQVMLPDKITWHFEKRDDLH